MNTRTSQHRRLAAAGTMIGMALVVTVVPLTASALVTANAGTPAVTGSTELADVDLVAMRDEERLSGDTYAALADLTGVRIFTNIARAEERHESALERLLTARGVDVAALDDEAGEYSVAAYEELYDEFLDRGARSLDDALEVGVQIEERDIADLESVLDQDLTRTERRVVTALLRGSEQHLAAFTRTLDGDGSRGTAPGTGPGPGPRWGTDQDDDGFGAMRSQGRQGRDGSGPGHGMSHGPGSGDCPYADTDS